MEDSQDLITDANNGVVSIKKRPSISSRILKMALWGVVEVVGVVVILFLLNYFNLFPISKIFPNQLGFLPHTINTTATNQVKKIDSSPKPIVLAKIFPINPKAKAVNAVTAYYDLRNVFLERVEEGVEGNVIITFADPNMKDILLTATKETSIVKGKVNSHGDPGQLSDLKSGLETNAFLSYDAKDSVWTVKSIYLFPVFTKSNSATSAAH